MSKLRFGMAAALLLSLAACSPDGQRIDEVKQLVAQQADFAAGPSMTYSPPQGDTVTPGILSPEGGCMKQNGSLDGFISVRNFQGVQVEPEEVAYKVLNLNGFFEKAIVTFETIPMRLVTDPACMVITASPPSGCPSISERYTEQRECFRLNARFTDWLKEHGDVDGVVGNSLPLAERNDLKFTYANTYKREMPDEGEVTVVALTFEYDFKPGWECLTTVGDGMGSAKAWLDRDTGKWFSRNSSCRIPGSTTKAIPRRNLPHRKSPACSRRNESQWMAHRGGVR